jgi:lipopolysaccharide biosynthesis protein
MSFNENDDFDYAFYLDKYEDLRYMSIETAHYHWNTYGMYENRKCNSKNAVNYITNITIVIHLFHEVLFDEFMGYITNVKKVFNKVNVIFTVSQNSTIEERIKSIDSRFVVLKVENKGVDIYPFLESVRYMRHHFKTDFVLKIHSKISTNQMYDNWRQKLIEPITNYNNLVILQHYFKKMPNIGYVGAQSCCLHKKYDDIFPQNIQGLNELCDKFPYLHKEWTDFMGGTMFWISKNFYGGSVLICF